MSNEFDAFALPCLGAAIWQSGARYLIRSLLDRILKDQDNLAGSLFLDADPSRSRNLKARLRIPHDYFAAIPPDPASEELERVRADVRRICGRPWAWGCTGVCALEDAYHG